MNDRDRELFEAELRRLAPARTPAELMERLAVPRQCRQATNPQVSTTDYQPGWWRLLRWLAPAATVAALVMMLLAWRLARPANRPHNDHLRFGAQPALKADAVEIDQRLVSSFDAVARLPDGQAIRLRCREWTDEVVLRDSVSGIVIERSTPRLEVVPVSFETY